MPDGGRSVFIMPHGVVHWSLYCYFFGPPFFGSVDSTNFVSNFFISEISRCSASLLLWRSLGPKASIEGSSWPEKPRRPTPHQILTPFGRPMGSMERPWTAATQAGRSKLQRSIKKIPKQIYTMNSFQAHLYAVGVHLSKIS